MSRTSRAKLKKKIAIVVPVYNEAKNVRRMSEALIAATAPIKNYDWEFIFVNDGSTDASLQELRRIAASDSRVLVIDFSRNFGKEIALTAGLHAADAHAAIFLDADLQHPPELIPQLVKKWEEGAEVISSIRISTIKKSAIRDIGSKLFYYLMNKVAKNRAIPNTTDFKLIDRKVMDELRRFTEHNRLFRGLIDWIGFRTAFVEFVAPDRGEGKASYSLSKLTTLAVNSFASFSLVPLRMAGFLGLLTTVVSGILLAAMIVVRLFLSRDLFSSISFVIVANTFIMGIMLTALGIVAIYIGQIHSEVINRPLYVVRETIRSKSK